MEGFTTFDFLRLDAAKKGPFRSFPAGSKWGRKWEYGWFRTVVRIPQKAAGQRVLIHPGAAEEMLVYVDGQEAGSIDKTHAFVEVTAKAEPGRVHEIYAQVTVAESHFGVWNEAMFQAYADYHTLYDLLLRLPDSSMWDMEIARALKKFTYIADFELEEPERTRSIVRAVAALRPLLEKKNGDTAVSYTVFGQSHLDLAWHRGTYTAVFGIKERLRRAESVLREAEYLEGLLRLEGKLEAAEQQISRDESGAQTQRAEGVAAVWLESTGTQEVRAMDSGLMQLETSGTQSMEAEGSVAAFPDSLWDFLLRQEFHDVLAGSSIRRVNEEAMAKLDEVIRKSRALVRTLLRRLARGPAAFNSLKWERRWQVRVLPPCGYILLGEHFGSLWQDS